MKMAGNQDVISPIELEDIVGSLKPTVGIECVGSGKLWHRQVNMNSIHCRNDFVMMNIIVRDRFC